MSPQDSLFQEPGSGSRQSASPPGSPTPFSAPQPREDVLTAQLKAARRQIVNLFILLLVVSGTLSIALLQQVRYDRADLTALAPQEAQMDQARQVIANFNAQTVPAMQDFVQRLGDYAKTHRDVLPILAKYGLVHEKPAPTGTAPAQTR